MVKDLYKAMLTNFGHGGNRCGFPTYCHKMMEAKRVFRGGSWQPLFAWRLAMAVAKR